MNETLTSVTGLAKSVTSFGIAIIGTLLVVDVLFPGSTGLVANVGLLVGQFSQNGLAGLIVLMLFVSLFKDH